MKKHSKSTRFIPIILSLILVMVVSLSGCITVNPPAASSPSSTSEPSPAVTSTSSIPTPPDIPQEVMAIWKAPPVSEASTPDLSGKFVLQTSKGGGETVQEGPGVSIQVRHAVTQETTKFYLQDGQWIDIIASSNVPVYFSNEMPDYVGFCLDYQDAAGAEVPIYNSSTWAAEVTPFYFRLLYENRSTSTQGATIFTTAVRMFACGGPGDYHFSFSNVSTQKVAEITYRIYKLGITPGWGQPFIDGKLKPWFDELYRLFANGTISEAERERATNEWVKQFE